MWYCPCVVVWQCCGVAMLWRGLMWQCYVVVVVCQCSGSVVMWWCSKLLFIDCKMSGEVVCE